MAGGATLYTRKRLRLLGLLLFGLGSFIWLTGHTDCHECGNCDYRQTFSMMAEMYHSGGAKNRKWVEYPPMSGCGRIISASHFQMTRPVLAVRRPVWDRKGKVMRLQFIPIWAVLALLAGAVGTSAQSTSTSAARKSEDQPPHIRSMSQLTRNLRGQLSNS